MNLDVLNNEGLMFRGVHAAGPEKGEFFTGTKLSIQLESGAQPRCRIKAPYPETGEECFQKVQQHPIYACREVVSMDSALQEELLEMLRAGIVHVCYCDSSTDEMVERRATLQREYIDAYFEHFRPGKRRRPSETSFAYWDPDAVPPEGRDVLHVRGWWSCMRWDRITGYFMLISEEESL